VASPIIPLVFVSLDEAAALTLASTDAITALIAAGTVTTDPMGRVELGSLLGAIPPEGNVP